MDLKIFVCDQVHLDKILSILASVYQTALEEIQQFLPVY